MLNIRPLDPTFPIERQLSIEAEAVVLINVFTLDKADEPGFLTIWQDDAAFMQRQPGFISTQLHRALGENPTYLNYAVWESNAAFRAAFIPGQNKKTTTAAVLKFANFRTRHVVSDQICSLCSFLSDGPNMKERSGLVDALLNDIAPDLY